MTAFNTVKDSGGPASAPPAETAVLIVGAGPTGLALACDLRRRGIAAHVVERGAGLFPGSRGKGIQPRTQEVFEDLGILEAVQRDGGRYPLMLGWRDGTPLGSYDLVERAEPRPGVPYPETWMLPQWRTQELLYERLRELDGAVSFGTGVTGLCQDADGVTVTLAGGRTVRARYAVGCDGGRSTVRTALGITMTGEPVADEPTVVADVRIAGLDRTYWHVWPDENTGTFALCPMAGTDTFQLVAQHADLPREAGTEAGADTEAGPARTEEALRALLAGRSHLEPGRLKDVLHASSFRANAALADRFRSGRVFLAGDAAHIHSPAGGQGLNTSVQDAYNLGWKLGLVLDGHAAPSLLDTYEEERVPVAADVLGLSTALHGTGARRTQAGTGQLTLTYRGSSLAGGPEAAHLTAQEAPRDDAAPQPGDRAPDATLGDGSRLFERLRGPHFTLLVADGNPVPDGLPSYVRTVGTPPAPPYPAAYHLIRPDGYVATVARSPERITGYLAGLAG